MNNFSVVFTKNNARVVPGGYHGKLPHLHNPDIDGVSGIPPHYWKKKGYKIVAMSIAERQLRDAQILLQGCDNKVNVTIYGWHKKLFLALFAFAVIFLLTKTLR